MDHIVNKTVSLGDTGISLHTPAPVCVCGGGGGTPDQLKSKVPLSSIWPNLHGGGGGVLQTNWNPKFLNLAKFSFGWGWGVL